MEYADVSPVRNSLNNYEVYALFTSAILPYGFISFSNLKYSARYSYPLSG